MRTIKLIRSLLLGVKHLCWHSHFHHFMKDHIMTSLLIRLGAIGFFTVQIGCSGAPAPTEEADVEENSEAKNTDAKEKLDLNALAAAVNKAELVPSPIEMETNYNLRDSNKI